MKGLSEKAKAEAYDKIVDMAKKELNACGSKDCDAARQIFRLFPELAESKDEKIRKDIISYLALYKDAIGEEYGSWIAWLEKQSNKPQGKTTLDTKFRVKYAGSEYNVLNVKDIDGVTFYGIEDKPNHIYYVLPNNCEIVSGQNIAWSEDDNKIIEEIINDIDCARAYARAINYHTSKESYEYRENWLKSLKNRYTWKPRDEQIKVLEFVIELIDNMLQAIGHIDNCTKPRLKEILVALKKLRGE